MKSHNVDYEIFGDDLQMIVLELDPAETVIAEAGSMNYLEEGIQFETKMGDGSKPNQDMLGKLLNAGKRMLTGESIFLTHFTNQASGKRKVAFSAPYPGKIIAVNLQEMGGHIFCQKDAFLCAALGTEIGIAWNKKIGVGLFGGEGFILEKLTGDGLVFLHAGGTIIKKELNGETLRVDTGCLVSFTSGINYDIQRSGGLKSMFFGGEGLFLTTLTGKGTVWLQSLPFRRLADRVIAASGISFRPGDEGSVLGGIGKIIGGAH